MNYTRDVFVMFVFLGIIIKSCGLVWYIYPYPQG